MRPTTIRSGLRPGSPAKCENERIGVSCDTIGKAEFNPPIVGEGGQAVLHYEANAD